MKRLNVLFLLAMISGEVSAQTYQITSPDKHIKVNITADDSLVYDVIYKDLQTISKSSISLNLDKAVLGESAKVVNAVTKTVKNTLHPLYGKSAMLSDNYQQLTIRLKGNYAVVFRAYNEGMAYR